MWHAERLAGTSYAWVVAFLWGANRAYSGVATSATHCDASALRHAKSEAV